MTYLLVVRRALIVGWISAGLIVSSSTFAQDTQFDELAKRVVNVSADVKPGDVVVVYGGKHIIPMMESLSIEVGKAGGMVTMFLSSDRVDRSYLTEVPEKYLEQEPKFFAEWLKHVDVWIGLPGNENPKAVYGDIPQERMAKAAKSGQIINDMLNQAKLRLVSIGYPTNDEAERNQVPFATYEKMHWDAVNADYGRIAEQGAKIKKMLEGAKVIKVTSAKGTNFSFSVGSGTIIMNDGIVTAEEAKSNLFLERIASLPGGSVFCAPLESSANGKVVVPRTRCMYEPMTGVAFEFRNGKLENFKAETGGKCFQEAMAPYAGPKDMFGYFSIGLNPGLKVMEDPGDYRPGDAAGMVWIGVGDNSLMGGTNKTQGSMSFPLTKATVEIDGKVVVKEGGLVF